MKKVTWRRGRDWLAMLGADAPLPSATPISQGRALLRRPLRGFSSLRSAGPPILHTRDSILSYVKVTWRRGRDSNPRNLAVHLISNQTQSTTGSQYLHSNQCTERIGSTFSPLGGADFLR